LSTTFNIGGVSFHPAPTGVRVVYAEGYAAFFIPAPDPQLSVITRLGCWGSFINRNFFDCQPGQSYAPLMTSLSSSPLGPNHGRLRATVIGPCEPFLTVSEPNPALLQPMIRTLLPPWPRS